MMRSHRIAAALLAVLLCACASAPGPWSPPQQPRPRPPAWEPIGEYRLEIVHWPVPSQIVRITYGDEGGYATALAAGRDTIRFQGGWDGGVLVLWRDTPQRDEGLSLSFRGDSVFGVWFQRALTRAVRGTRL